MRHACILTAAIFILLVYSADKRSAPDPGPRSVHVIRYQPMTVLAVDRYGHNPAPEHNPPPPSRWRTPSIEETRDQDPVMERFVARQARLRRACALETATATPPRADFITGHTPANVSMCIVHKAASTVWLRLLLVLMSEGKTEDANEQRGIEPSDVTTNTKWVVHHLYAPQFKLFDIYNKHISILETNKVITARNPYTRLWSAYVDKFIFPMFHDLGSIIIQRYRAFVPWKKWGCGHDVTFAEFIKYVIEEGHNRGRYSGHWLPVSDICDPCTYKPEFVVKQETLPSDIEAITRTLGLSATVGDAFGNSTDESIIEDELDVHIRGFLNVDKCMTKTEYLQRIWIGLVVNGYVQPQEDVQSLFERASLSFDTVLALIRNLRVLYVVDMTKRAELRQRALVQAYRRISKKDLVAIQGLYERDFQMFDYDNTPPQ